MSDFLHAKTVEKLRELLALLDGTSDIATIGSQGMVFIDAPERRLAHQIREVLTAYSNAPLERVG